MLKAIRAITRHIANFRLPIAALPTAWANPTNEEQR